MDRRFLVDRVLLECRRVDMEEDEEDVDDESEESESSLGSLVRSM